MSGTTLRDPVIDSPVTDAVVSGVCIMLVVMQCGWWGAVMVPFGIWQWFLGVRVGLRVGVRAIAP